MGVLRLIVLVVVAAATLVGASSTASAQRGVPQSGFPSWHERMVLVYVNRARADPQADLAGCTVCGESACYPSAVTPVGHDFSLNRASRFHSANLELTNTSPQVDSPCSLVTTLSTAYVPTGACLGEASCSCVGGTLTGTTGFVTRINRFSPLQVVGESLAIGTATPRDTFYLWMYAPEATTTCGTAGNKFLRFNMLSPDRRNLGVGRYNVANDMWTADFTTGPTVTGTLIAGGHEPQFSGAAVEFRTNYFDTGAPTAAVLNVDGACSSMTLERGSATNATYLASRTLAGTTCRRYRFEFIRPGGATVVLPETGSYGVGDASCADWTAAAPAVCGTNMAPTIATAAIATPNPVNATTTQLSVLGADDAGEPALTYTWSATGPAAVAITPNGTNAAKTATATFTTAGTYVFTATVRDVPNLTVTSSVTVTVNQTLTAIAVTPASASVPLSGTQQFTRNGTDQFGIAMVAQPTVTWTVGGGGTISATGLFTAGTTAGGPFTVSATGGGRTGTAQVTVTTTAPTIATAASATPNPVAAATTQLSVLGADDGGEAALTYTWAGAGPAAVTITPNGTNGAKTATATFIRAGAYVFTATVRDTANLTVTSSVAVTVNQTLTAIAVTPASASVPLSGTQQFTRNGTDQFGIALLTQPTVTWTVGGGGTISATGLFTAGTTPGGPFTVTATSGGITGTAQVSVATSGPTIATAASATPNPVIAATTQLSVLGADDGGEPALTYTWAATGPASVTIAPNGSNAAKTTTATFTRAGAYTFTATVRDASNATATSSVIVTVNQTLTTISVAPSTASVPVSTTQQFTRTGFDQFGIALAPQPGMTWTWTVSGGGTISATGLFTAGATPGGPFTVTATSGGQTGTAQVTVTGVGAPTVAQAASATPNPVTGTTTTASVLGADNGGESSLTYTWTSAGPAPVTVAVNGTNAAKSTTITFTRAGSYTLTAEIKDATNQTATSSVAVVVQQTPTTVALTPSSAVVVISTTRQFAAAVSDQFGMAATVTPTWSVSGGGTVSAAGLFTAGAVAGGPFTLTATAGAATATAQIVVTLTPDTTPPTVTIVAPIEGEVLADQTMLVADATDDIGMARVVFTIAGQQLEATAAPWQVLFDASALPDGAYVLEARAFDLAGNESTPASVNVQRGVPVEPVTPDGSMEDEPGGCCATGPARSGDALVLLFALIAITRRRRR